jgi:RimJ/RimL family protein N-acetyltransferase
MHEKIGGFIEEGRLRKHVYFDGEYHDVVILSLFRENFIGH